MIDFRVLGFWCKNRVYFHRDSKNHSQKIFFFLFFCFSRETISREPRHFYMFVLFHFFWSYKSVFVGRLTNKIPRTPGPDPGHLATTCA